MLRERAKLIVQAHKAWDICLTGAAFIATYFIKLYILPHYCPVNNFMIAYGYSYRSVLECNFAKKYYNFFTTV